MVAVVTRYFGGTKLGAGGLIRAYASTVAAALKEIGIVEGTLNQTLYLTIDYPQLGKLQNHLEHQNIHLASIDYTDKIRVTLMVPEISLSAVEADLTDLLQGQLEIAHGPCQLCGTTDFLRNRSNLCCHYLLVKQNDCSDSYCQAMPHESA